MGDKRRENERCHEINCVALVGLIVILAYVSLLIELLVFPVPSSASSYSLWRESEDFAIEGYSPMQNIQQWSFLKKSLILGLPLVLIVITFVIPILIALGLAPDIFMKWITANPILIAIGILLLVVGRLITFVSALAIRKDNSQEGEMFTLHDDSWFRFSRNPIQVGMYIFSFGLLVLYPSWIFLLGCVLYVAYMDYKIKMEEDFLRAQFGSQYSEYCERTRRYL